MARGSTHGIRGKTYNLQQGESEEELKKHIEVRGIHAFGVVTEVPGRR